MSETDDQRARTFCFLKSPLILLTTIPPPTDTVPVDIREYSCAEGVLPVTPGHKVREHGHARLSHVHGHLELFLPEVCR